MAKPIEPIRMTLTNLLQNPTGQSTAFMAARSRIIKDLEDRYIKLIGKHKNFKYRTFRVKDEFLFLFEIPSESEDGVFYDVAIQFFTDKPELKEDRNLTRYYVKLFSNSPNFTFTYAYVLNQSELIPELFKDKCSEVSIKEPPKIKNPVETYGFEKSCYFAALFLREHKLLSKFELMKNLFIFDKLKILLKVKTAEGKLKEVSNIKKKKALDKKKQKQLQNKIITSKNKKSKK